MAFNSNGGSSVKSQTVKEGKKARKPKNPTKEGYVFDEWQLDGVAYDFNTPVTEDITLDAVWEEAASWTVTFNSNGGSEVQPQTVVDGGHATKPSPDPTKAEYDFVMWCKDAELTTEFVFATEVITADTTVYAKWDQSPAPVWDYDVTVTVATEGATGVLHIQPVGGEYSEIQMTYGGEPYVFGVSDGDLISEHYTVLAMYDADNTSLIEDITTYATPITEDTTIPVVFPVIVTDWTVTISIANQGGEGVLHLLPVGGEMQTRTLEYGGTPVVITIPDGDTIAEHYPVVALFDSTNTVMIYNVLDNYQSPVTQNLAIEIVANDNVGYIYITSTGGTGVLKYTEIGGTEQTVTLVEGQDSFTTKAVATAGDALSTVYSAIAVYNADGTTLAQDLASQTITGVTMLGVAVPVVAPIAYSLINNNEDNIQGLYYQYNDAHGSLMGDYIGYGETKVIWSDTGSLDIPSLSSGNTIDVYRDDQYTNLYVKLDLPNHAVTTDITANILANAATQKEFVFQNNTYPAKTYKLHYVDYNGTSQVQTLDSNNNRWVAISVNSADLAVYTDNYISGSVVHVYEDVDGVETFVEDVELPTYMFRSGSKIFS